MRRKPSNSLSDWWRIIAMGTVLAGLVFLVFFHDPDRGDARDDEPPVRQVRIATPVLDPEQLARAKDADRSYVIVMEVHQYTWTEGGAWWEVGIPEVSDREQVRVARAELDAERKHQRVGV